MSALGVEKLPGIKPVAPCCLWAQEGEVPEYIANSGKSCFYCKSQLYTTLQGVADEFIKAAGPADSKVVMYNGTNADDRRDPTRLGLVAAVSCCMPTFRLNDPEHVHDFCCSRSQTLYLSSLINSLAFGLSINCDPILRHRRIFCCSGQFQRGQPSGGADEGRSEGSEPRARAAKLELRSLTLSAISISPERGGKL